MIDAVRAAFAGTDGGNRSVAGINALRIATAERVVEAVNLMAVLIVRACNAGSIGIEDGGVVAGDSVIKVGMKNNAAIAGAEQALP